MHLILLTVLLAAGAPADGALRAELQAAYDSYAAGCVRQDLPAVLAMLAPDVHWRLVDGSTLDRAGVESALRDFLKTLGPGSVAKYTLRSLTQQGDQVRVDALLTVTTLSADPDSKGKPVKHVGRSGWRDVWKKGPSGWLYLSGEEYELPTKKP